jgi:hypothetical protein
MIPLELVTMGASAIFGGVMTIWSQSLKAKQAAHERMIQGLTLRANITDTAREFGRKNPKFEFTRRCLALMSVFSVIVLPKLAVFIWPEVPVMVGYTEFHPGFWFFTEGHEVVKWQTARGFALTPLDTHFCLSVAGLYFGASVCRNS